MDILAIDDNQDGLDILSSALISAGARVRAYTSAAEAIEAIRAAGPDVVLCDIAMPGMDGFEVLTRIRAAQPSDGGIIPVLAVTAYASTEDREKCLRAGFQGHMAKPYDTAALIRQVAAMVARA
jgi:CheY-like chemotaxis protein